VQAAQSKRLSTAVDKPQAQASTDGGGDPPPTNVTNERDGPLGNIDPENCITLLKEKMDCLGHSSSSSPRISSFFDRCVGNLKRRTASDKGHESIVVKVHCEVALASIVYHFDHGVMLGHIQVNRDEIKVSVFCLSGVTDGHLTTSHRRRN
jgi:hypothetical protein